MSSFIFTLFTLFAPEAFAYLDPGSGSSIVAILIGMVAAVGTTVKIYWTAIKSFLAKIFKK